MENAPELGEDWLKCPECGATYTDVRKLGAAPMSEAIHEIGGVKIHSWRPNPRKKRAKL